MRMWPSKKWINKFGDWKSHQSLSSPLLSASFRPSCAKLSQSTWPGGISCTSIATGPLGSMSSWRESKAQSWTISNHEITMRAWICCSTTGAVPPEVFSDQESWCRPMPTDAWLRNFSKISCSRNDSSASTSAVQLIMLISLQKLTQPAEKERKMHRCWPACTDSGWLSGAVHLRQPLPPSSPLATLSTSFHNSESPTGSCSVTQEVCFCRVSVLGCWKVELHAGSNGPTLFMIDDRCFKETAGWWGPRKSLADQVHSSVSWVDPGWPTVGGGMDEWNMTRQYSTCQIWLIHKVSWMLCWYLFGFWESVKFFLTCAWSSSRSLQAFVMEPHSACFGGVMISKPHVTLGCQEVCIVSQ